MGKKLKEFTDNIATCRGPLLSESALSLADSLERAIEVTEKSYVKPMTPLFKILSDLFKNFSQDDEFKNTIEVVRWCNGHNLIQQGLTILEEGILTFLCDRIGVDKCDVHGREEISKMINGITVQKLKNNNNLETSQTPEDDQAKSLVGEILQDSAISKLAEEIYNIANMRNDINHAGWRPTFNKYNSFKGFLDKAITEIEVIYQGAQEVGNSEET
nr:TM1812 family CRISPR-associated protein [Calorimonas adulescens]